MTGTMSADLIQIIIFAMIAAFVALRLIGVFGRHQGDEQPSTPEHNGARRDIAKADVLAGPDAPDAKGKGEAAFFHADPQVRDVLQRIAHADRQFDPARFLEGARKAYEMILEAFWKGDRETLASFVDADVLANFSAAIEARQAAGQTVENRLVHLNAVAIMAAEIVGNAAHITVAYEADIIAAVRDRDGNLAEGSLSDTHLVKDIWTFARPLRSRDPNWTLVETASG
ncbi:MAG: Tim44/TimA family putative adaptor protein [Pseudomonadota bacterium]